MKGIATATILETLFVIGLAVMFIASVLGAIGNLGTPDGYDTKWYATDIALLIDALHAVPKDVSVFLAYAMKPDFTAAIKNNMVAVAYKNGAPSKFYYTKDTTYVIQDSTTSNTIYFQKNGNSITTPASQAPFQRYCPQQKYAPLTAEFRQEAIAETPGKLVAYKTGDSLISARTSAGTGITIYTSPTAESQQLACLIARELDKHTTVSIVPVNNKLYAMKDPRKLAGIGILIDVHQTIDAGIIRQAANTGVISYGLA